MMTSDFIILLTLPETKGCQFTDAFKSEAVRVTGESAPLVVAARSIPVRAVTQRVLRPQQKLLTKSSHLSDGHPMLPGRLATEVSPFRMLTTSATRSLAVVSISRRAG